MPTSPHNSGDEIRRFYDHPWASPYGIGSALMALNNPDDTHTSFQVVNGIDRTTESGSAFIAKWSLLTLIHGFLTSGEEETLDFATNRITQLPRVQVRQPTIITELEDPSTIWVRWNTRFRRWDNTKYTRYFPNGFTNDDWLADLRYVLLYSQDNGDTWQHMLDDTEATAGERPDSAYLLVDERAGNERYKWEVPSHLFPEGSYLVRVEAYRATKALHFAHHQEKIFISR